MWAKEVLTLFVATQSLGPILDLAGLINEPLFAGVFLLLPYVSMISLDIRARRQEQEIEEKLKNLESYYENHKVARPK